MFVLFSWHNAAFANEGLGKGAWYVNGPITAEELQKIKRNKVTYLEIRGKNVSPDLLKSSSVFRFLNRLILTDTYSESFLSELTELHRLQQVTITQVQDLDPALLGNLKGLPQLRSLDLNCPLLKPDQLGSYLPLSLMELGFMNSNISDEILADLPRLDRLRKLGILKCPVKGNFLQNIKAPLLETITFTDVNLDESCLDKLTRFPIKHIYLYGESIKLSPVGLAFLGKLQSLTSLTVLQARLDTADVSYLCRAKNLTSIYIGLSNLDDGFLNQLCACSSLNVVRTWSQFSSQAVSNFKKRHPRCTVVGG